MSESTERAAFEADAAPMGFDLTRQSIAVPEPWAEYADESTGHRWAGWLARAEGKAEPAWQPRETAPKDERILLFVPAFGPWNASWWPGSWSWAREQWAIHSPFSAGDKALMGVDIPQPSHWMPLPSPTSMDGAAQAATSGGER